MKKSLKMFYGILALVIIVSAVLLTTQTGLLQGRLRKSILPAYDPDRWFMYKNSLVSVITSPVTSIVTSKVTSSGGVSNVPSVVTSPVASAVTPQTPPDGKGTQNVKELTGVILETIANKDFTANPSIFTLSAREKQKILNLYKRK